MFALPLLELKYRAQRAGQALSPELCHQPTPQSSSLITNKLCMFSRSVMLYQNIMTASKIKDTNCFYQSVSRILIHIRQIFLKCCTICGIVQGPRLTSLPVMA